MEISFKKSLQEIDLSFDKYKEFADRIYKKKPINQEQINEILREYNQNERFDETNLVQSILDTENKIEEIKKIVDEQIYKTCSTQIKTIKRLSKNKIQIRFQVNHLTNEYEKCIRILLILLRNKISLITTNEPLKPKKNIVAPIQTRIPKADNQELKRLQESSDRRFAIRKQQEYDRIMAQKIHDQQLAEQLHKEERDAIFNKQQQQQDRDLALAYYYKDHPYASAITRLTRKRKPKPKRKTPKEDKKLKKPVKKQTQEKETKKEKKETKNEKNKIYKK